MTSSRGAVPHSAAEIVDFHRTMLVDDARMRAFTRAIMATVRPGDVVCDIGAGTGVLSFLAATAGAARVYAVEQGPVLDLARQLSERNGFADRVTFLAGHSTEIELPEPADVIVTETIGNAAFDEGIVQWVADARTRLLRPGGRVVPRRVRLWAAPMESWDDHAYVSDWSSPSLPFDFGAARQAAERLLWWVDLSEQHLLGAPVVVAEVDLISADETDIAGRGTLTATRDGVLHGLACWFEAHVADDIRVDNAPPSGAPSWSQAMLPIATPIDVRTGQRLEWAITVSADGESWDWEVALMDPVGSDDEG